MKRIALLSLALIALLVPAKVLAVCDYAEQNRLNALAANVNADYTVATRTITESGTDHTGAEVTQEVEEKYFVINVYNLNKDIYIVVTNNYDATNKTYNLSDAKDGIISFEAPTNMETVEFTIKVYTTNTDCSNNALRTFTVRSPMVNPFTKYAACRRAPDFYLCQEFLTSDIDITDSQFLERVNSYIESMDTSEGETGKSGDNGIFSKILNFISNYWIFLVSGIIVIGVVITVIVITKIRRRVI